MYVVIACIVVEYSVLFLEEFLWGRHLTNGYFRILVVDLGVAKYEYLDITLTECVVKNVTSTVAN